MASFNHTGVSHVVFYLLGIPGRADLHMWISIPLFISYICALLGNGLLIFIILTKRSLHEPMYLFLCMLAGVDIVLATTTEPKALAIFWCNSREISLNSCIAQLYFLHSSFISESGILLIMAFDRYIAICYPLRYTMILTYSVIGKIGVAVFLRAHCTIFPIIFLLKRLTFCRNNILPHTYCEHIGLAKYACDDIRVNIWYGFFCLNVNSDPRCCLYFCLLCSDSSRCLPYPFPRRPSQSSENMWLPCLCHHPFLWAWDFYSPHSTLWTPHPTTYAYPAGQCLYPGSTYVESHHLWG